MIYSSEIATQTKISDEIRNIFDVDCISLMESDVDCISLMESDGV